MFHVKQLMRTSILLSFWGFRWTDWLPSHLWQTELVVPHYFFILPYFVINVNTLLVYLKIKMGG
jgi:hypothetical protein